MKLGATVFGTGKLDAGRLEVSRLGLMARGAACTVWTNPRVNTVATTTNLSNRSRNILRCSIAANSQPRGSRTLKAQTSSVKKDET